MEKLWVLNGFFIYLDSSVHRKAGANLRLLQGFGRRAYIKLWIFKYLTFQKLKVPYRSEAPRRREAGHVTDLLTPAMRRGTYYGRNFPPSRNAAFGEIPVDLS